MNWGEKGIETAALANGGRVEKYIPMTDESITFKVYPVSCLLDGSGVAQLMHPQTSNDTTHPILAKNTVTRKKHKLVILWSLALPAAASTVPAVGPSYRIQIINAYLTKYTPSFDGKILTAEMEFKWAPFDRTATENKREESTAGTALPAAATSATAW